MARPTATSSCATRSASAITHWAVAIAFIFLFLSGLAMFHPFFFWISLLFGGGQFMRFLHPIAGVGAGAAVLPLRGPGVERQPLAAGRHRLA